MTAARPIAGMAANGKPNYPQAAQHAGEQGTVVLRVEVSADGLPVSVRVLRSSGHPRLDDSAVSKVASSWRFVPATEDGRPVPGTADIPIDFSLNDEG